MQDLLAAFRPTRHELISYPLASFIFLLLINVNQFLEAFFERTGFSTDVALSVRSRLADVLDILGQPLTGQVGNSVIWSLTALLGLAISMGLLFLWRESWRRKRAIAHLADRSRRWAVRFSGWAQTLIRLLASGLGLAWVFMFGRFFLTDVPVAFFRAVDTLPGNLMSYLAIPATVLLTAAMFYIGAIIIRLVCLRVRVFATETL